VTSIFQHALGAQFGRLHPQLQQRFGFSSADATAWIGTGTMQRVWHGRGFTRPFLAVGASRNILIPETGRDVPFTIENYAYRDSFDREAVSFVRTFSFATARRWDAQMIHSPQRGTIVDYLGTHQHVAVDLHLSVDEEGALLIRSGEQRIHEGPLHVRVPRLATGTAELRESYDEAIGAFRIQVKVANERFGPLFGYDGTFTVTYRAAHAVPEAIRPVREQARI
jgi:hypothetical protein